MSSIFIFLFGFSVALNIITITYIVGQYLYIRELQEKIYKLKRDSNAT